MLTGFVGGSVLERLEGLDALNRARFLIDCEAGLVVRSVLDWFCSGFWNWVLGPVLAPTARSVSIGSLRFGSVFWRCGGDAFRSVLIGCLVVGVLFRCFGGDRFRSGVCGLDRGFGVAGLIGFDPGFSIGAAFLRCGGRRLGSGVRCSRRGWRDRVSARPGRFVLGRRSVMDRGWREPVVVRELLDQALTGRAPFGAQAPVHDVPYDGDVHDVVGLDDGEPGDRAGADAAGGARAGGGDRDVRVPEVEVMEAEPVPGVGAGAGGCGGAHGRRAQYVDPATAGAPAGEPRRGVRAYVDPARQHRVEERVAVDSVRQAVGDPSAGESAGHMSHLPPGVGVSRSRQPQAPVQADGAFGGLPPGVPFPAGVHADMVSEGADSKSLVLSGGQVSSESGVVVMMPGAGPGGTMGAVRIPLASYVKGGYGAPRAGGFFANLPGFVKECDEHRLVRGSGFLRHRLRARALRSGVRVAARAALELGRASGVRRVRLSCVRPGGCRGFEFGLL